MSTVPDTFTPLFDNLPPELDIFHAAVLGFIWRYEQLSKGKCFATLESIATKTRMSSRTVLRRIDYLKNEGWIIDFTPGRRNASHEYKTGQKFQQAISNPGMTGSHTQLDDFLDSQTDSQNISALSLNGVPQGHTDPDHQSVEDTIKKQKITNENKLLTSEDLGIRYFNILLENLKPTMPKPYFDMHVANLKLADFEGNILHLSTKSQESLSWLNSLVHQTANNIAKGFHPEERIRVEFGYLEPAAISLEVMNG